MKKLKYYLIIFIIFVFTSLIYSQEIDLSKEYSMDEFQNGIRAFHEAEYERAITFFIKSLGFDEDNYLARYYLGESYRKAGYENNAIFVWNNLLALGYSDRTLRSKLSYLYNKKGILNEININKKFILREDIKGYYDNTASPLFMKPSQIFIDKNNHYYIASFLTGMVLELDPNLRIVKNHFPVINKFKKPFGVVVDNDGLIYVSDFENDEVVVIDRNGLIKRKIGYKGIGKGALLGPQYLLFDDEENLYVTDSGNHRVNKYNKNGDPLFSIGSDKTLDGLLEKPAGMFYDNNKIYICDRKLNEVLVYDKSGNYIKSFGKNKLQEPYDITKDNFGRFMILCKNKLWVYEEENNLWYVEEATGDRLQKGISLAFDKENNLILTDFNTSRLLLFSHERERYTNLNVNIERVFSYKFPNIFMTVTVEKDDFSIPSGVNNSNIYVYENGERVKLVGDIYTKEKDNINDIMVIYDNNKNMGRYKNDLNTIVNDWFKSKNQSTNIGLVSIVDNEPVLLNNIKTTRLSFLDSINKQQLTDFTDKGAAFKYGVYNMLNRFSKKSVIIVTNCDETGRDFNNFQIENCIALATNNNIPVYIISFGDGQLRDIYKYIAEKTGGEYYRVYKSNEISGLIKKIEETKGREIVFSYMSKSLSRFGDEPISVIVEVRYSGMNGVGRTIYYPAKINQ